MSSFVKIVLSIIIILVSLMIKSKFSSSHMYIGHSLEIEDELYDYMYGEVVKLSPFLLPEVTNRMIIAFIGTESCPFTLFNLHEYYQIAEKTGNFVIFIDSESRETAYDYLVKSDLAYITFMHNEPGFHISPQVMNRVFIVDLKNKSGLSNIVLYPNFVEGIDEKEMLLSNLKSFF